MSLLELFLNPKAALAQSPVPLELYPAAAAELARVEPDYGSACRVLNAEGASLNPLQLLGALPAGMPLHLAGNVLSRMLSGLQHRHRQGQVVRWVCWQDSQSAPVAGFLAGNPWALTLSSVQHVGHKDSASLQTATEPSKLTLLLPQLLLC